VRWRVATFCSFNSQKENGVRWFVINFYFSFLLGTIFKFLKNKIKKPTFHQKNRFSFSCLCCSRSFRFFKCVLADSFFLWLISKFYHLVLPSNSSLWRYNCRKQNIWNSCYFYSKHNNLFPDVKMNVYVQ
jgi:hypothetical protein